MIQPHFAIFPAIFTAVLIPPKKYEINPIITPYPHIVILHLLCVARLITNPNTVIQVAPSAIYCAISNLFIFTSPLFVCFSALADVLILHEQRKGVFRQSLHLPMHFFQVQMLYGLKHETSPQRLHRLLLPMHAPESPGNTSKVFP